MRKYHQLLLVIISVVSVFLLLIYRHEYNRLRYVLEVFNFFGQPNDCNFDFLNVTNNFQHDWGPKPVWTVEENFAIYSAFLKNEKEVEALIVHKTRDSQIYSCFLWVENSTNSVTGKVSYSKIKDLVGGYVFLKYYCQSDTIVETPYAVSFSKSFKKVLVQPLSKKNTYQTSVCVTPSETYSKQDIVEFISFHKIIGVDAFIIYDNIPYKFMYLLQKLSLKLGIEIVNYSWNFPYTTDTRAIIEEDCILRTKHRSNNVITLDRTEYLVPKHHFTLSVLLDSYDISNRINRFGFKSLVYCVNNKNKSDQNKEPIVLHNLHYDSSRNEENVYAYRSKTVENVVNTQEISVTVAAIHKYISCTSKQTKVESTMLRFAKDFKKSTLFKLFKYNRL